VADGEVEIRAAVRQLVAEGADHIKIMASGTIEAGKVADLLVVEGNPLESIRAIVDVRGVYVGGCRIELPLSTSRTA
jgi:imidazolonepropionase-like amidohydrolase